MAARKARRAEVMEHFKWPPEAIARLTDRQIEEYCFHARTKDGAIQRPAPKAARPMTEEQHVARVRRDLRAFGRGKEEVARAVAGVRAWWARKRGGGGGDRPADSTADAGGPPG